MSQLLKPFQHVLNLALAQDSETADKLEQFDQRSITIIIIDLNQTINVSVNSHTLLLTTDKTADADLTITGKALDLAKLGSQPDKLFSADIEIHGDVQFAKQLRDLVEGFDFDWEQQLARVTGDTLAYPIAHGLRELVNWAKNSHQSMQHNVAEYLKEEITLLPDHSQIDGFLTDIDKLSADCDRIAARINRLQGNS